MPHLIYGWTADLAAVHRDFKPMQRQDNGWILKALFCYLSHDSRILIFECIAVRSGFSQNFFLRAEQKGESVTFRVDPHTNVEKNEGVKRMLLAVRDLVVSANSHMKFEKSNLPPELLGNS